MVLVWDSRILCDKAVYTFNQYVTNLSYLYLTKDNLLYWHDIHMLNQL